MNTQNNPQDVEKIIRDLPDFEMRKRKEIAFLAKLFGRHVGRGLASFSILFLNLLTPMKRIITFAVLVIFAVGIVTAFSLSPGVTRGHFLYPLKRAEEQLELLFSVQSLSKVKTHLDFASRRLEEVKVLMGEKPATSFVDAAYAQDESSAPAESGGGTESSVDTGAVVETVEEVVSETESAMQEAEAISDPAEAVEALGEISEAQEVQSDTLQNLAETAPEEVAPALEEAVVNTESDQSSVVEAQSAVEEAVENGETEVQVALETSEEAEECEEDEDGDEDGDEDECDEDKRAEKLEEMKEDAEEELAEAQEEIAEAKAKLAELGVSEEDAAKLLSRLDAKLLAAQEALAAGNYGKAEGLAKAAQALSNNVKSYEHRKDFLKKKDKDDDEEDEDEDNEEAAPPSEGEGEGAAPPAEGEGEETAPPSESEDEETEVEEDEGEGRPESPGRSGEHVPEEESEGEEE